MTTEQAEKLALEAFEGVAVGARYAAMLLMTDQAARQVILDGSAYSPSWRVLPQGERVFQAAGEIDPAASMAHGAEDLMQAFEEVFDREVEQWNGRHEEHMVWDEGMLFVCGPDFDFEGLAV